MSKQYLTTHTISNAHPTDIFSLAVTPTELITASGASSIKIFDTTTTPPSVSQELVGAHKLGCHHVSTSGSGTILASAGFDGALKVWHKGEDGQWAHAFTLGQEQGVKAGEVWAVALTADGGFLTATTIDGRVNVWDISSGTSGEKVFELSTGMGGRVKGSFGMCVDVSRDGQWTAVGCENGGVYVFSNETRRLVHSLPGLVSPVRTLRFSPLSTYLAAAGDSKTIALYSVKFGEQIANLTGSQSWILGIDWSDTGEYLLSGSFDGKAKVWSVEQRACVATHSETEGAIWAARWLPKGGAGKSEYFVTAGQGGNIAFYREATGG